MQIPVSCGQAFNLAVKLSFACNSLSRSVTQLTFFSLPESIHSPWEASWLSKSSICVNLWHAYSESPQPTLAMASCGIGGHWGVDQWWAAHLLCLSAFPQEFQVLKGAVWTVFYQKGNDRTNFHAFRVLSISLEFTLCSLCPCISTIFLAYVRY